MVLELDPTLLASLPAADETLLRFTVLLYRKQLWTDIADKDISCFTSDIKESINEEVRGGNHLANFLCLVVKPCVVDIRPNEYDDVGDGDR